MVSMRVSLDAAKGLIARAARRAAADHPDALVTAAEAKLFAADAYVSATRDGIQVFGGYGYSEEDPLPRHYSDAKDLQLGAGTLHNPTIVIPRGRGPPD